MAAVAVAVAAVKHGWCRRCTGHRDAVKVTEAPSLASPGRVFVRCPACGYESPGMVLDLPKPRQTQAGNPKKTRMKTGPALALAEGRNGRTR